MVFQEDAYYWPTDSTRTLHVYLPDEYDETDERYPVMYMFDGQNLFYDSHATYGKSWGLKEFLDNWEKKLIVIGLECGHEGFTRLDEYCPYELTMLGHRIDPLGEQTFQWIINDVKPQVDRELRTWPHREATGVGGSSMGGIMSLYGVIAHNDVFGKAACLSTGVRLVGPMVRQDLSRAVISPDTRIYLGWGEGEGGRTPKGKSPATDSPEARATRSLARELMRAGVSVDVFFQEGGQHNEASWELQNPRYLDFLWKQTD